MEDNYGYAVPYPEDTEVGVEGNNGSYLPGSIIIEDSAASAKKICVVPPNDCSLPDLDIASPESSCSLELGKPSILSSSSLSSGPLSVRSENASDDVPYELSALSQTRHTPPPRFTQFNFRKRRSRGTPKNSPKVNMLSIKEVARKQQDEKQPKKVAKLVGTDDADGEVGNKRDDLVSMEMASTETQTDAEFVEGKETVNLMPQNIIFKAFARSISEPCLATSKKSVSFVTRDNYISDGEEANEMSTPISEGAKKRMSRAKKRFSSKGMIDASKITDSLKLLRVRLGLDPDGTNAEGVEAVGVLNNEVEVKTKHKTLTTIKNKLIRKIASSPVRSNKSAESDRPVTALSNVNIGDTGIKVTEDNCSTTALRGSPLSTRSSSIQEVEEAGASSKSTSHALNIPTPTTETVASTAKQCHDVPTVHKFFNFTLGRRKIPKNKVEVTGSNDEQDEPVTTVNNLSNITNLPQESYFETLDNMGKMSPAIRNIGNKYKLFPKTRRVVAPDDQETQLQNTFDKDRIHESGGIEETPEKDALLPVQSDGVSVERSQDMDEEYEAKEEMPSTYAPNEGDQKKPLIKRTKKSTNVAIDTKELEVRKPNAKKPSSQKKPLKKTKSITQRLRRIWSSRDKVTKSEHRLLIDENKSSESVGDAVDESQEKGESQDRRVKLTTHSDTNTVQMNKSEKHPSGNGMASSQSAGALAYPVSAESSTSEEENHLNALGIESPRNINQNCDTSQRDAIFRLQNFVHSFTQSENDVFSNAGCTPRQNVQPQIRRKAMSSKTVQLSTSSSTSATEPCLESEDANIEFPIPNYENDKEARKVDDIKMDVVEQEGERKFSMSGDGKDRKPRRVQPTRVLMQHETMQTDPIEDENDEVFEADTPKGNKGSDKSATLDPTSTIVMHCQVMHQNGDIFHPNDKSLDFLEAKNNIMEGQKNNILKEPRFQYREQKLDSVEMDVTTVPNNKILSNGKEENKENELNESVIKNRARWTRHNSAPVQVEKKLSSFPRFGTSPLDFNDSSLDKWDMMKLILEETQAIYLSEFGNLDLESPRLIPIGDQQAQRPFDYDESFSAGSSASTASASETKDMETGDFEEEDDSSVQPSQNTSNLSCPQPEDNITDLMDKNFIAENDDPCGSAPVPSPCNPYEVQTNAAGISASTLSSSLGRLEAFGDKGGSGGKRKQSELATPLKDEHRGRKVRLESPESDDEGPPRARRVPPHEKL